MPKNTCTCNLCGEEAYFTDVVFRKNDANHGPYTLCETHYDFYIFDSGLPVKETIIKPLPVEIPRCWEPKEELTCDLTEEIINV